MAHFNPSFIKSQFTRILYIRGAQIGEGKKVFLGSELWGDSKTKDTISESHLKVLSGLLCMVLLAQIFFGSGKE